MGIVAPGMAAEDGTLVVPLLERCAIESALHLAKFSHPSLPPLRLALTLPSLHFHLSPGRLHRVMRVLDGALPRASPLLHLCCTTMPVSIIVRARAALAKLELKSSACCRSFCGGSARPVADKP